MFVNKGLIRNDLNTTLNVSSEHAVFKNDGTIASNQGHVVVDAPIIGDGTIELQGLVSQFFDPTFATVELDGAVGRNQTIDIEEAGFLTIGDLRHFHADIKDFSPVLGRFNQSLEFIILPGVDVTSFTYHDRGELVGADSEERK